MSDCWDQGSTLGNSVLPSRTIIYSHPDIRGISQLWWGMKWGRVKRAGAQNEKRDFATLGWGIAESSLLWISVFKTQKPVRVKPQYSICPSSVGISCSPCLRD